MKWHTALSLAALITACSGGGTPSSNVTPSASGSVSKYTIGGEVAGLTGSLVLQNNSGDDLTLTSDGTFTFATSLADASAYAVTIKTQPTGLSCAVSNGSGTLKSKNVASVTIHCGKAMITFNSTRNVDGSNSVNANSTMNIWTVTVDGVDTKAITTATSVSGDGGGYQPQWSSKGNQLVFSSSLKLPDGGNADGAAHNIWMANSDGTGLKPITTNSHVTNGRPQWSPDGQKVVFSSWQNSDGSDANGNAQNVWVVNTDGSGLKALTTLTSSNASADFPQWSPDGTKIIFYSNRKLDGSDALNPSQGSNIWFINADGTGLKALTALTTASVYNPQWSPDGAKIIFVSSQNVDGTNTLNSSNTSNIWVVNVDGTALKVLTTATAASAGSSQPQWSADGTKIVYQSQRKLDGSNVTNNAINIWTMNADGSSQKPVTTATTTSVGCSNPQWSPDGTMIVFQSTRKVDGSDAVNTTVSDNNIWVVNADGSGLKALTVITAQGVNSAFPQWSF